MSHDDRSEFRRALFIIRDESSDPLTREFANRVLANESCLDAGRAVGGKWAPPTPSWRPFLQPPPD